MYSVGPRGTNTKSLNAISNFINRFMEYEGIDHFCNLIEYEWLIKKKENRVVKYHLPFQILNPMLKSIYMCLKNFTTEYRASYGQKVLYSIKRLCRNFGEEDYIFNDVQVVFIS